jgi:hypothetical protein
MITSWRFAQNLQLAAASGADKLDRGVGQSEMPAVIGRLKRKVGERLKPAVLKNKIADSLSCRKFN